jgi:hypothetical protein
MAERFALPMMSRRALPSMLAQAVEPAIPRSSAVHVLDARDCRYLAGLDVASKPHISLKQLDALDPDLCATTVSRFSLTWSHIVTTAPRRCLTIVFYAKLPVPQYDYAKRSRHDDQQTIH